MTPARSRSASRPRILRLDPLGHAWRLAHRYEQLWTVGGLTNALLAYDLTDPRPTGEALIGGGLMATVGPDPAGWARAHRLAPLLRELCNSPDEPDIHTIGLPGLPLLRASTGCTPSRSG